MQKILAKIPNINLYNPPTDSLESIFKIDFNRQTEYDVIINRISDAGQEIMDIYQDSLNVVLNKISKIELFIFIIIFYFRF